MSDEEYSDDEDVSWKVRRAAAKCLQAIIAYYPDLLKDIYPQAVSALITRFKEREENVKSDIFQTLVELVKQIGSSSRRYEGVAGPKPIHQLRSDLPSIMKAAVKQLKDKSVKTKQGMFAALQELVAVAPESLGPFVPQVMPGIQAALQVQPTFPHLDDHYFDPTCKTSMMESEWCCCLGNRFCSCMGVLAIVTCTVMHWHADNLTCKSHVGMPLVHPRLP